ncbi:FdrA family protein, partial [bacterium]|nr:FdrA family protein [bacterium]
MAVIGRIIKGAYYDSVTLMRVSGEMSQSENIQEVSIVMGTQANLSILESSDMLLPEFKNTGDADLIIAVRIENPEKGDEILDQLAESLKKSVKTNAS